MKRLMLGSITAASAFLFVAASAVGCAAPTDGDDGESEGEEVAAAEAALSGRVATPRMTCNHSNQYQSVFRIVRHDGKLKLAMKLRGGEMDRAKSNVTVTGQGRYIENGRVPTTGGAGSSSDGWFFVSNTGFREAGQIHVFVLWDRDNAIDKKQSCDFEYDTRKFQGDTIRQH